MCEKGNKSQSFLSTQPVHKLTTYFDFTHLVALQFGDPDVMEKGNQTAEIATKMEQVSTVTIKAPQFMETSVEAWFTILEAQFNLRNVSVSQTQFYHVLAALPPETVARLTPTTLASNSFIKLKTDVINLYAESKAELFEKLLCTHSLTTKPSLFLEKLNSTATKVGMGEELVRHKFVATLPPHIAPVIATQTNLTLQQLGKLADELLTLAQPVVGVNQVTEQRRSLNRKPFTQLTPFMEGQLPKICRSHIFFGREGRTCRPWCQWPDKSSCRISTSRSSSPNNNTNSNNNFSNISGN